MGSPSSMGTMSAKQWWEAKVSHGDPAVFYHFAPPNGEISNESQTMQDMGAWQVFYAGVLLATRHTQTRGHAEAMRQLLKEAWAKHELLTGEECPHMEAIEALRD